MTNCEALARSLERVAHPEGVCLVDGFRLPQCRVEHRQVIDGDARSAAIAAASVIAKVTRDRYMERCDETYPGFGFALNAGYSTPEHRDAIIALGPSQLHRRSFAVDRVHAAGAVASSGVAWRAGRAMRYRSGAGQGRARALWRQTTH